MGLSPLTRGNRRHRPQQHPEPGPIPAHAGEPITKRNWRTSQRAYPRSRGGTIIGKISIDLILGLSPLTRGNQGCGIPAPSVRGPIPAHAGEPTPPRWTRATSWAYPRSRGGTSLICAGRRSKTGLSPLTRGNQSGRLDVTPFKGPIPAHAGEPRSNAPRTCCTRAYPRSRGGTSKLLRLRWPSEGLSPLTRGNRPGCRRYRPRNGPIPAHAGEPPPPRPHYPPLWAYPRSRGGTQQHHVPTLLLEGLSPLTRGNRSDAQLFGRAIGPIPAHAGEPSMNRPEAPSNRAYPRSRGGTCDNRKCINPAHGLSPLTRGNLTGQAEALKVLGPIPAHAGEPVNQSANL